MRIPPPPTIKENSDTVSLNNARIETVFNLTDPQERSITLPDGEFIGQRVYIIDNCGNGTATVHGTFANNMMSKEIAQKGSLTLIWSGDDWHCVGGSGGDAPVIIETPQTDIIENTALGRNPTLTAAPLCIKGTNEFWSQWLVQNLTFTEAEWVVSRSPELDSNGRLKTPEKTGTTTDYAFNVGTLLPANFGGVYWYQVRYKTNVGAYSRWSKAVQFTTADADITAPVINKMTDGVTSASITISTPPKLVNDVLITHEYEISTSPDMTNPTVIQATNNTCAFTGLNAGTTYYVRTRTRGEFVSATSNIISITTLTPTLTKPVITGTATPNTITVSVASGGVFTHDTLLGNIWYLCSAPSLSNIVQQDANTNATHTFSGLPVNTTYYVALKRKGAYTESVSNFVEIATLLPVVNTPTSLSATSTTNSITASSTFSITPTGSDTHYASQWQISTSPSFDTLIYNSNFLTTNTTSFTFTNLTYNTTYYWRVRHQSALGILSDWCSAQSRQTSNITVNAPTGLAYNSVTVSSFTASAPTFTVSPSGADTYSRTRFQLSTSSSFSTLLQDSGEISSTSYTFSGLSQNTTYYWRAYHKSSLGIISSWTAAQSVTTAGVTISTPYATASSATQTSISASSSSFSISPSGYDSHGASQWQLCNNSMSTIFDTGATSSYLRSYTFSGLSPNTTYYWRVRYQSAAYGIWSAWSAYQSQTTPSGQPTSFPNTLCDVTSYGAYTYSVPSNVYWIKIQMVGGGGGSSRDAGSGGGGGYVECVVPVTPSTSVQIYVGQGGQGGGQGESGGTSASTRLNGGAGGWPDGGSGGTASSYGGAGGGGGSSRVYYGGTLIAVAAGGGGGGDDGSACGYYASYLSGGSLKGQDNTSSPGGGGGGGYYGGTAGSTWGGGYAGQCWVHSGYVSSTGQIIAQGLSSTAPANTTLGSSYGAGAPAGLTGENGSSTYLGYRGSTGRVRITY